MLGGISQARRRAAVSRDDAGWEAARGAVMGLFIHGDAAFSGLGLTAEALQLSGLPGYTTGGSIHGEGVVGLWGGGGQR